MNFHSLKNRHLNLSAVRKLETTQNEPKQTKTIELTTTNNNLQPTFSLPRPQPGRF